MESVVESIFLREEGVAAIADDDEADSIIVNVDLERRMLQRTMLKNRMLRAVSRLGLSTLLPATIGIT